MREEAPSQYLGDILLFYRQDGLFLFTVGNHLGGIEHVGVSENGDPSEFPDPGLLTVEPV